jgi:hypothetical protein
MVVDLNVMDIDSDSFGLQCIEDLPAINPQLVSTPIE